MPPVLSRLFSPAGFVLVGLLFLLPFVGVSCSAPDLGTMDASYTGFDLVAGGDPEFDVESPIAEQVAPAGAELPTPGVPWWAGAVLAMLALGMACALLAHPATRLLAAGGVAAFAVALLVITQVLAESGLVDSILENARILQGTTAQNLDPVATKEYVADAVGPRAGFWVSLVALVLLTAGNVIAATRSRSPVRGR